MAVHGKKGAALLMVPLFSIAAIPKNKESEKMRGGKRKWNKHEFLSDIGLR